jgi:hypothetical protein
MDIVLLLMCHAGNVGRLITFPTLFNAYCPSPPPPPPAQTGHPITLLIALLAAATHYCCLNRPWIMMAGGNADLLVLLLWPLDRTTWPCQGIGKIALPHHAHQPRSTQR